MTCGDVPVLSASADASHGRDPEQMAEVHVDIRKLLQFLAGQQSTPTKAVCSECALASFFAGHTLRSRGLARCMRSLPCGRRASGCRGQHSGPAVQMGAKGVRVPRWAGARGGPGFRVETCVEALTAPPLPRNRG